MQVRAKRVFLAHLGVVCGEPTITTLPYRINKKEGTFVIFYLEGGTFNVSILEISRWKQQMETQLPPYSQKQLIFYSVV